MGVPVESKFARRRSVVLLLRSVLRRSRPVRLLWWSVVRWLSAARVRTTDEERILRVNQSTT